MSVCLQVHTYSDAEKYLDEQSVFFHALKMEATAGVWNLFEHAVMFLCLPGKLGGHKALVTSIAHGCSRAATIP